MFEERIKQLIKAPGSQYIFYKNQNGSFYKELIYYWAIIEREKEDVILPVIYDKEFKQMQYEDPKDASNFDRIDFYYELE